LIGLRKDARLRLHLLPPNIAMPKPAAKPTAEPVSAPAVARAARILDLLAQSASPMSLADLARQLDAPKSSVHNLCATLTQLRLINRLESGLMTLGPHVMNWANAFLARSDVTQEFFAAWEGVDALKKETITLSVLDGGSVVYTACRNGSRPLGITFRIGMRLPAPYTATGKAMLSTLPDEQVRELLQGAWPRPLTPAGTPSLKAFLKELAETRTRGYSIDAGEVREGMHCFGAPVFDSTGKQAVAGIAVSLMAHDATAAMQKKVGQEIRQMADHLSARLGASGASAHHR
jgi:DNA-binding IclR family transcriptional regulator